MSSQQENNAGGKNRIKATGLWLNKTKDGKTYFSGTMGQMNVQIFPNDFKTKDNHPDLQMYFVEKQLQKANAMSDDSDPINEILNQSESEESENSETDGESNDDDEGEEKLPF